jgi:hypothetical protein
MSNCPQPLATTIDMQAAATVQTQCLHQYDSCYYNTTINHVMA